MKHMLTTAAFSAAAVAMSLSLFGASAQTLPEGTAFLKEIGLVSGDATTGDLRLDTGINRAELMKMVSGAATKELDPFTFRDCLGDINSEWFAPYVCWAAGSGYVAGYPDGNFHAGRDVNRAEALKIISEVFHLDTARMAAVADESLWYDLYVKNAVRQGLIAQELSGDELAAPATRGEVFDYIFRAMAVTDGKVDRFQEEMYRTYPETYRAQQAQMEQERELTPAEEALLGTLRSQLAYGMNPLSSTGSAMMSMKGTGMGMSFDVRLDMKADARVEGTTETFEGLETDLQLVLDVSSTSEEEVSFKAVTDLSLAMDTERFYARLNNFEMLDVTAPLEARVALTEALAQVELFTNSWFHFDLTALSEGVPLEESLSMYQTVGMAALDLLERTMKTSQGSYFEVIKTDEGDQSTIMMKPRAEMMGRMIEDLAFGMQPSANRFAVRQFTTSFDSALSMFARNTSMMLSYDTMDLLLRRFSLLMEPVTVDIPDERVSLTVETASQEFYTYDKDFTVTMPEESQDFMSFIMGPGPYPDEERPENAPVIPELGEEGTEAMPPMTE